MEIETRIAWLLEYAMKDVEWQFSQLTAAEKEMVGNQENLTEILRWCVAHDKGGNLPDPLDNSEEAEQLAQDEEGR